MCSKPNLEYSIVNNSKTGVLCTHEGVVFLNKDEANTFVKDFGGIVVKYDRPLNKILAQLKRRKSNAA